MVTLFTGVYCNACNLMNDPHYVKKYVLMKKHTSNVAKVLHQTTRQAKVLETIQATDISTPKNEKESVYRFDTTYAFLAAGIPIEKIDTLRPYLEKYSKLTLTAATNLRTTYVPRIAEMERDLLIEEVKGKKVSIIFDGTTRVHECFAILLRLFAMKRTAGLIFCNV